MECKARGCGKGWCVGFVSIFIEHVYMDCIEFNSYQKIEFIEYDGKLQAIVTDHYDRRFGKLM